MASHGWENAKENIQPLRHGRDPAMVAAALSGATPDVKGFEARLTAAAAGTGPDAADPLALWCQYYYHLQQTTLENGSEQKALVERACYALEDEARYRDDRRYMHLWMFYASTREDPLDLYKYMRAKGIGRKSALFYNCWANDLERARMYDKAVAVYELAEENGARPREALVVNRDGFLARMEARKRRDAKQKKKAAERAARQSAADPENRGARSRRSVLGDRAGGGSRRAGSSQAEEHAESQARVESITAAAAPNASGAGAGVEAARPTGSEFEVYVDGSEPKPTPEEILGVFDGPFPSREREEAKKKENRQDIESLAGFRIELDQQKMADIQSRNGPAMEFEVYEDPPDAGEEPLAALSADEDQMKTPSLRASDAAAYAEGSSGAVASTARTSAEKPADTTASALLTIPEETVISPAVGRTANAPEATDPEPEGKSRDEKPRAPSAMSALLSSLSRRKSLGFIAVEENDSEPDSPARDVASWQPPSTSADVGASSPTINTKMAEHDVNDWFHNPMEEDEQTCTMMGAETGFEARKHESFEVYQDPSPGKNDAGFEVYQDPSPGKSGVGFEVYQDPSPAENRQGFEVCCDPPAEEGKGGFEVYQDRPITGNQAGFEVFQEPSLAENRGSFQVYQDRSGSENDAGFEVYRDPSPAKNGENFEVYQDPSDPSQPQPNDEDDSDDDVFNPDGQSAVSNLLAKLSLRNPTDAENTSQPIRHRVMQPLGERSTADAFSSQYDVEIKSHTLQWCSSEHNFYLVSNTALNTVESGHLLRLNPGHGDMREFFIEGAAIPGSRKKSKVFSAAVTDVATDLAGFDVSGREDGSIALKLQSKGAWEFYVYRTLHKRLAHPMADIPLAMALFDDEARGVSALLLNLAADGSLADVLRVMSSGRFDETVAMFFTVGILAAVEKVHAHGIVHADVALDNVLLRCSSHVSSSKRYAPDGADGWNGIGVALVDFNLAVDTQHPAFEGIDKNEVARYATEKSLVCVDDDYRKKGDGPWLFDADCYCVAVCAAKMLGLTRFEVTSHARLLQHERVWTDFFAEMTTLTLSADTVPVMQQHRGVMEGLLAQDAMLKSSLNKIIDAVRDAKLDADATVTMGLR